ncbi:MAG: T9SS type A sorting domain-containing protein [Draconibacterium sp.]|nr:T9SS type A sorting domain-containing protein [Draconibacterium sp.]
MWELYLPEIRYAFDIQTAGDYMTIASRDAVFVIDENDNIVGKISHYQFGDERVSPIKPKSAGVSNEGSVWIADSENVLVRISDSNFEKAFPSGPLDNDVFSLYQSNSGLWISPGGLIGWEAPRFQRFGNDVWDYFTKNSNPELDGFFNILSIAVDPLDENHFFVASWGGGLLEYQNDEFVKRYTNNNSPLETALPQQPDEPYVRIGGLDFDTEGNLWITNAAVAHNLHKLSPAGEWESFVLPKIANLWNTGEVLVNKYDDKWVLVLRGNDIYVADKTGKNRKQLLVTSYFNNGQSEIYNRMNDVYSIAEDNKGAIWVGTSKGVALYNSPSRIWDSETMYATQPSLDLNDGVYHPLLATETVTAIAVDGANRKWFGTKESGVFLISENGDKEVLHFTKDNSPLLSNQINAISINQKSGELFFGTDKGLISYQGNAISGKTTYDNVYVYPNPVRETYDGPITVTGLIENTDIKITDISGNLVYKTTSLGGQAVWDGTNLNGNRVKTGVYLVFCNDENGEETHITKLLFIN